MTERLISKTPFFFLKQPQLNQHTIFFLSSFSSHFIVYAHIVPPMFYCYLFTFFPRVFLLSLDGPITKSWGREDEFCPLLNRRLLELHYAVGCWNYWRRDDWGSALPHAKLDAEVEACCVFIISYFLYCAASPEQQPLTILSSSLPKSRGSTTVVLHLFIYCT